MYKNEQLSSLKLHIHSDDYSSTVFKCIVTLTRLNIYTSLSCGKDVTLSYDINVLGMLYCISEGILCHVNRLQ